MAERGDGSRPGSTPASGHAVQAWTRTHGLGPRLVGRVLATDASHGDLAVGGAGPELDARRRALVDRPWVWLHQVHGARVVVLGPDDDPAVLSGAAADAVVTRRTDVVLAVHTADCAGVALFGSGGVVGAVHAGWQGVLAGVLPAAVEAVRQLGADTVEAFVGPHIGAECYEFGAADLERLTDELGPEVRSRTSGGDPALDLARSVRASLERVDVDVVGADDRCTGCASLDGRAVLFSHRARRDVGRQAVLAWLEPAPPPGDRV